MAVFESATVCECATVFLGIQPRAQNGRMFVEHRLKVLSKRRARPQFAFEFCPEGFRFFGDCAKTIPTLFFQISQVNVFETRSANAFVQHVALRFFGNGYCYYVFGTIPVRKDPGAVDQKFVERYGIGKSKYALFRDKERGEAKVRYLRFERTFILVATDGVHRFSEDEKNVIRDSRVAPLECFGYSIRCRQDQWGRFHPSVRMAFSKFVAFRLGLLGASLSDTTNLIALIRAEHFLWFSGIKRQVFRSLKEVNLLRQKAGLEPLFLPPEMVANHSLRVFWN